MTDLSRIDKCELCGATATRWSNLTGLNGDRPSAEKASPNGDSCCATPVLRVATATAATGDHSPTSGQWPSCGRHWMQQPRRRSRERNPRSDEHVPLADDGGHCAGFHGFLPDGVCVPPPKVPVVAEPGIPLVDTLSRARRIARHMGIYRLDDFCLGYLPDSGGGRKGDAAPVGGDGRGDGRAACCKIEEGY